MYTKSLAWQDRYIAANRWRPTGTNSQHSSARLGADSSDRFVCLSSVDGKRQRTVAAGPPRSSPVGDSRSRPLLQRGPIARRTWRSRCGHRCSFAEKKRAEQVKVEVDDASSSQPWTSSRKHFWKLKPHDAVSPTRALPLACSEVGQKITSAHSPASAAVLPDGDAHF